jgi:glycosyltransferase involved in cell wall biosynthesis
VILAHLVARNEADRYLDAVLAALRVDAIHLYDDGSTDDTVAIAQARGAVVSSRRLEVPAFMEDEGAFRQAAWHAMVDAIQPSAGDWVLTLDCDELVVAKGEPAWAMEAAVLTALEAGAVGVRLPIPEIWELGGKPRQRLDGFWAGLSAPRLFAYRPGGRFRSGLACGSVPTYVTGGYISPDNCGLTIAHLGYADAEDRLQKYRRYAGLPCHNPSHISSICAPPRLGEVDFPLPPVWRGAR